MAIRTTDFVGFPVEVFHFQDESQAKQWDKDMSHIRIGGANNQSKKEDDWLAWLQDVESIAANWAARIPLNNGEHHGKIR